ncbi:hypothetical protein C8J57DRAFT_1504798 [Mycena rebaudengoi]|nr:hypothetical protein C8J57DRAFT_1504798 [Mycena rebaudengoi]
MGLSALSLGSKLCSFWVTLGYDCRGLEEAVTRLDSYLYLTIAPATMSLFSAKISYAIDASGSTAGLLMRKQKDFMLGMMEGYQYPASVIMWGRGNDLD